MCGRFVLGGATRQIHQFGTVLAEYGLVQRLGEYIGCHFARWTELDVDPASLNLFPNEMVADINVLGPWLVDTVAFDENSTLVVLIQGRCLGRN